MAVRFRGMLTDFKILEEGCCPSQAHQLEEGGSMEEVLNQSLKKSVPIFYSCWPLPWYASIRG